MMNFNLTLTEQEVNDVLSAIAFKAQALIGNIQQQAQAQAAQAQANQPKEPINGTPDQL